MKTILFGITSVLIIVTFSLISCDKVKNPYPKQFIDIDTTLLFGVDLVGYKNTLWPTFTQNTNTNVNVLIEDFTGHQCSNCPVATEKVEIIESQHENRVFIAGIHSGPGGNLDLQKYDSEPYVTNFTNPQGIEIATILTANEQVNNPFVDINRKVYGATRFPASNWSSYVSEILDANSLKVNLQSKSNYFPEKRGVILHTEVELLAEFDADLFQVVYLIEDSLISIQKTPSVNWTPLYQDVNYVHRDILRGCIDGFAMGRKLTDAMKIDKNGVAIPGNKYYLNYSYKLPEQYNVDNMSLLIYVYDSSTKEVLQVIKQKLKE